MKRMFLYMPAVLTVWIGFAAISWYSPGNPHTISVAGDRIDLSGLWDFQMDSLDQGIEQQWFSRESNEKINLPGSMAGNGKGDDVHIGTPWTGTIMDSSFFLDSEYAVYRQPGNIKIPFWLQPEKYYKGAAWYGKTVEVPPSWNGKYIELYLERCHWETTLWVDGHQIGMQNSLSTPHIYDLTSVLSPGMHHLAIRVDNRVKDIDVGKNAHSISDHTQGNWNGITGALHLTARPACFIADIQLFPDVEQKQVRALIRLNNRPGEKVKRSLVLEVVSEGINTTQLKPLTVPVVIGETIDTVELIYPMGENPLLWDEFNPNLYRMEVFLKNGRVVADGKSVLFGMRDFSTQDTHFKINGRTTFLRGTLECAIFPETGYPPTDVPSWERIFKICRSYGLNHMRFHSWCPPGAAFEAADAAGMYLQIECPSWANQGTTLGDGKPLDQYIYDESNRIVQMYGNHPSFVMMAYGNEPSGKNHVQYLKEFVEYWKARDSRRLYTSSAGYVAIPENHFNVMHSPRIHSGGNIINDSPPKNDYDWGERISQWTIPTIGHEIGQWCVYPDIKEIKRYRGVMKARNFEIFRDRLEENDMIHLSDSFLLASGKLQSLCYKAEVEAALRTSGFGGFQLLQLHDFPGQGTALVGVLNPFWEEKGYMTAREFSRFCQTVVPLARLPKMVYTNDESLNVPIEVANFGERVLENDRAFWNISDSKGQFLFEGEFPRVTMPFGNGYPLGSISQSLVSINSAAKLVLTVSVAGYENSWDIFVYPVSPPVLNEEIMVTSRLDQKAIEKLGNGGKVLLTFKKGTVKKGKGGEIAIGFSSIFWNTAWFNNQPVQTLGILCDPGHPALEMFPTEYHSNWQWWDAMTHSNAIRLNAVAPGLQPIVRVIDDWFTTRPLGLVFECRTGGGSLLVSGIDLMTGMEARPEARQLLYSFKKYMIGDRFYPSQSLEINTILDLYE